MRQNSAFIFAIVLTAAFAGQAKADISYDINAVTFPSGDTITGYDHY